VGKKGWGLLLTKQRKKTLIKLPPEKQAPGHLEGKWWVWADGKRTHIKYIQMAMRSYKPLPPGFYKACDESKDPGVIKMGLIAKKFKIKEMKGNTKSGT